jgi:hypothetical protein
MGKYCLDFLMLMLEEFFVWLLNMVAGWLSSSFMS